MPMAYPNPQYKYLADRNRICTSKEHTTSISKNNNEFEYY